jgi:DNA processing protein
MITLSASKLPPELHRLTHPPKQLYVSGEGLDILMQRPRIGIIGSRKMSSYGRHITTQFASQLAARGVVVVSGLALGVDSIAHESCLQVNGTTIAVLPTGLDKVYPVTHTQLARRIVSSGGLLVSEYPPLTDPRREHFIARNRIIAALSEGLLITEAAINSGSLHTARFALELGIPVMAVPGPINQPTSEGTNNLIKAGAAVITSVEDIMHALSWRIDQPVATVAQASTEPERLIIQLMQAGTSDGLELLSASQLSAAEFHQALTMLEITGRIRGLGNNKWLLI